jgi:hypothetical protein
VLLALLVPAVALCAVDNPVALKKQELAAKAMEAAQNVDEYQYLAARLQPMPNTNLKVRDMAAYVLPGEGWLAITDDGVWSVGNRSSLYMLLGDGELPRQLHIQGSYFRGQEPTRLFVNGQLLSETSLRDHTVELPPNLGDSAYLHITLQHLNPLSRHDVDPNSKSMQKIKFRLEQIRVW